jgi:hypothetical protein
LNYPTAGISAGVGITLLFSLQYLGGNGNKASASTTTSAATPTYSLASSGGDGTLRTFNLCMTGRNLASLQYTGGSGKHFIFCCCLQDLGGSGY